MRTQPRRSRFVAALLSTAVATLATAAAQAAPLKHSYFRLGSSTDGTASSITAGTVLMGGGTDVDAAFRWLCNLAPGGDFLVIRASGTDAYDPYVQDLCPGLNSVATLIVTSINEANDPFTRQAVADAEIVWIAGGDQSNYIRWWTGTALQDELKKHVAAGRPVGGTSAGFNVITQFIYSAEASKGVTSSQALADPFNRYMTFARDFISVPAVSGAISDTHFVTRDRMGRTLGFLCRIYANGWSTAPRAIAIDEETAVLVDPQGVGTVVGNSSAYFIEAAGAPDTCAPKTPLTYHNVGVRRVPAGSTFDVANWSGTAGTSYTVGADAGALTSTQPGGSAY
jgi:cyanophycinase-like exopeptidase